MDFIDAFVGETDSGLSPERYRLWSALSTISAVTDRRVWTSIRPGMPLYPNLYILLVGPPGAGKSQGLQAARQLLATQPHVDLAPSSTTHEAFIRRVARRYEDNVDHEGEMPEGRGTMVLAMSEWGTFMRKASNDDMALLADMYDCGDVVRETIGRGYDEARNLFINILSACTPAWFAEGFPPNSYEQGLPARFHFIWADGTAPSDLPDFEFTDVTDPTEVKLSKRFIPHLDKIARIRGFVPWEREAAEAFNAWKAGEFQPAPTDPMLVGYSARRPIHVAKLSLLTALSAHPTNPRISPLDFRRALGIMEEAEILMPKALAAAGGNTYRLREENVVAFVISRYLDTKRSVPEWEVRGKLGKLVPPNMVSPILEEMIASNALKVAAGDEKAPSRKFTPGVRK